MKNNTNTDDLVEKYIELDEKIDNEKINSFLNSINESFDNQTLRFIKNRIDNTQSITELFYYCSILLLLVSSSKISSKKDKERIMSGLNIILDRTKK